MLKEEVNVKEIEIGKMEGMTKLEIKLNYRRLGPRLKGDMKKVVAELQSMAPDVVAEKLRSGKLTVLGHEITDGDIELFEKPLEGVQAVEVEGLPIVVYLNTNITEELRKEGLARELIRRIQTMRKELDLEYDAKIKTSYTGSKLLEQVLQEYATYIMNETQSVTITQGNTGEYGKEWEIEGLKIKLFISRV